LDFSSDRFWQLAHKMDPVRILEPGQVFFAKLLQLSG
jgi:hypothetical protein